jgi:hypothetical protein
VKFLRIENDRYFFKFDHGDEKAMFEFLLRLYPVIPSAHQALSKTSANLDEHQRLLNEALAEQRKENQQLVRKLLKEAGRFKETDAGRIEMNLSAGEIEWLLQVLNDVRVGNWILLGSPEEQPRFDPDAEDARNVIALGLASNFQMDLLTAIQRNA